MDTNKTCHPGQILTTQIEDHFLSALLNDVEGLTFDWWCKESHHHAYTPFHLINDCEALLHSKEYKQLLVLCLNIPGWYITDRTFGSEVWWVLVSCQVEYKGEMSYVISISLFPLLVGSVLKCQFVRGNSLIWSEEETTQWYCTSIKRR